MKESPKTIYVQASGRTHPALKEAAKLMPAYELATGSRICILDQKYMPINELFKEICTEKNICLFCMKYKSYTEVKSPHDFNKHPCREMHINAVKEAQHLGGSFTYICELGFIFWTSPIYVEETFVGALTGGGYLGVAGEEVRTQMYKICGGEVTEKDLQKMIGQIPRGDPRKIKALSELALICAESLSSGSKDYHAIMKRRAWQQANLSAKIEDLKSNYQVDGDKSDYPLDKEKKLIETLRRGDTQSAKEILNEILAALLLSNPNQFKHIQYRAIELAVLLSRTDIGPGFSSESILETNNHYLNSIQEAQNIEELTDALYKIVDDMAGQIFTFLGVRHAAAIKKAEYFILENFTHKISLDEIAKASGFSAPYFSTIFKEEMGENISSYINRMRVEKAGYMLLNTNVSLSKITRACGFEDQSWFSKIFKNFTGISPGKYRNQGGKLIPKIHEPGFSPDYLNTIKKHED